MPRDNLNDLTVFLVIARERSFTKAAAQLGVSQSALSHTIRGLEERLGVRLLTRTTRSVAPTEAGLRLLNTVGPRLDEIEHELTALRELGGQLSGNFRITASDHAIDTILMPKLAPVLREMPDIKVEFCVDYGLSNIVADGYDAGVRFGETIDQDMIAVKIGPEARLIAVASPEYFAARSKPLVPQDLLEHQCINLRLPTHGGTYSWEFSQNGRDLKVHVTGQITCNGIVQIINAALNGLGIAYVPEDLALPHITAGRLEGVLGDWSPPFLGYHLYYPHRCQSSSAFGVLVEALRYRE